MPAFTAFATVEPDGAAFSDRLVDYALTARMEEDLDEIASGERDAQPWLTAFYFGDESAATPEAERGLRYLVSDDRLADIDPAEINSIPIGADADGEPVVARVGRFGPYLRRGDATRPLPDDLAPDELTLERALALLDTPTERVLGTDPARRPRHHRAAGALRPVRVGGTARRDRGPAPARHHCCRASRPRP